MPKLRLGKDGKKNGKSEPEATPPAETQPVVAATSDDAQAELGQLRGILFGGLQAEQQQALERLESRIVSQAVTLRSELEELVQRLENRISELDARSTRDQGELRDQMNSQRNLLNDALEERSAQVTKMVNDGVGELRDSKIDRQSFSKFLTDLSQHLEQQVGPAAAASDAGGAEQGELRLGRAPWHPASA